ncbi:Cyclic di-GMP phosphodiesterase response regulator RpfG [Pelotomaculum propionicicum]|uniref:Cyclic di-GMP phosphodiesterase response regulator RpfG n=1 Tax=Pelotomaculum propionicicum TaxID=258475 RepID=A0A4Y7RU16_9FIRM|nr:Cyclic di-GMP phosphodiesterase response regulator RpfG [Pelotomaculum propionicicum]
MMEFAGNSRKHNKLEEALAKERQKFEKLIAEAGKEKIIRFIPLKLQTGEYLVTCEDITQSWLAEQKLRAANRHLLDIIDFLPDATFVVDRSGIVIAWNKAMEEMSGISKDDIIGKGDYAYAVPFYGVRRPVLIDMVMHGDLETEPGYEFVERKENTIYAEVFAPALFKGEGANIWCKASPLYDSEGKITGAIESVRDITERKRAEGQLKYLSLHDNLTGLYNRTFFEEEMQRAADGRFDPVGIIVCDLDGLKFINDTLGHDTGDSLLLASANVIKSAFRKSDIVARIGGDEFAVLLNQSGEKTVEEACDRIKAAIDKYNLAGHEIPLNISMGFAVGSVETASVSDLFKEADNNMYREKLHRSHSARSALVQTLMKALEARDFITEGHALRLQDYVTALARAIGMPKRNVSDLNLLAKFHDIGKVGVRDSILFKPGPLTTEEAGEMQRHSEIGHRIAQSAPDLAPIADWILKHHEWWDGSGYPLGLKEEEIPLECRILAIADAYDAMTNDRPYRKAMPHETAVGELEKSAGVQFDPELVRSFLKFLENNQSGKNM